MAFSAFLRDYLMRGGRYVPPGETFEAFQRHFEATEFDPRQVAADLKQASEWYATIQGQRPDPNHEVEAALDALWQLDSSTCHVHKALALDKDCRRDPRKRSVALPRNLRRSPYNCMFQ